MKRELMFQKITDKKGVTLAEIVVAIAVLGITLVGITKAFNTITGAVLSTKSRTLASNVAQEQMELLKQRSYYRILITSAPAVWPGTSVSYDPGYYPPDEITVGGVVFNRLTLVEVVQEVSGNLQTFPPSVPDGGMKLITINVVWDQLGEQRNLTLTNIASNPDTAMTTSFFEGTVTDAGTFLAIPSASVSIVENPVWQDITDVSGDYKIGAVPNTYNVMAMAPGYFNLTKQDSLGINSTQSLDFQLVAMDSGTVQGVIWINDKLLLSRVMGSSPTASGFSQEYVEIFNPTTWTWTVDGEIGLKFQRRAVFDPSPIAIDIDYITASIDPGQFYLFANTTTITVAGQVITADATWDITVGGNNDTNFAYFDPSVGISSHNVIPVWKDGNPDTGEGGLQLYEITSGNILDRFGWIGGTSTLPPSDVFETTPFDHGQNQGLNREEEYVRFSSTAGYNASQGPAYDSGNNDVDWLVNVGITAAPKNTTVSTQTVISGVPAVGAVASANDGLSTPAYALSTGSPPYAPITLPEIATGTWSFFISSGAYTIEDSTAVITAGLVIDDGNIILDSTTTEGLVAGVVTDAGGTPLGGIEVSGGGQNGTTNAAGVYSFHLEPSLYNVTANGNNGNPSYVSETISGVTVGLGQVTSGIDFSLSQGGRLKAFVTRDGFNPLPGIAVAALDANSQSRAQEVSQSDGYVQLLDLSTGTYTVLPILDSGEVSNPVNQSVAVVQGVTTFVTTFTVTNAFGTVGGTVSISGELITTGALIVVTPDVLGGSTYPPDLSSATLSTSAYYTTSSNESGEYLVSVRGSTTTTFNVYGYYSTLSGGTPTVQKASAGPITVNSGLPTTQNLTW